MDVSASAIGEQINAWLAGFGSAAIIKTIVTAVAEKANDPYHASWWRFGRSDG
jgi:hypothetical protein